MEQVIVALTKLISDPGARKFETPAEVPAEVESAPQCVRDLAQALASNAVNLNLGEFRLYRPDARPLRSLEDAIEMSDIPLEELPEPVDPSATLDLAPDGGGMSTLGVGWSDGAVSLLVVEIDDPIPENLVQRFTTPEAFLAFLERNEEPVTPEVRALLGL